MNENDELMKNKWNKENNKKSNQLKY